MDDLTKRTINITSGKLVPKLAHSNELESNRETETYSASLNSNYW